MTAARAAKRRSARERLKGRRVRRGHFDVVVGDGDLPALVSALEAAEKRKDEDAVKAAADALGEVVERLWFRALPGGEYETVRVENPTPMKKNGKGEDEIDFMQVWPITPILAARCSEDPDLQDEDYWRDELAMWPLPDRLGLQAVLIEINTTPANGALAGKALSGMTR